MYTAEFKSGSASFAFGFENGVIFDIEPLSGHDVKISASQGFNQIGETVTGMSAGGVKRRISGAIIDRRNDTQIARRMQKAMAAFVRGKLIVGERYCEAVVEKTPEFVREKNGVMKFAAQVYCPNPFFLSVQKTVKKLGGYTPSFSFPVNYAQPHRFGVKSGGVFVNCRTDGDEAVTYRARFTTLAPANNVGLVDVNTLEEIRIHLPLEVGEEITFGREDGHLIVTKTDAHGVTTDEFAALSDESTLFMLRAGDNVLKPVADAGEDGLVVFVEYENAYGGVIV